MKPKPGERIYVVRQPKPAFPEMFSALKNAKRRARYLELCLHPAEIHEYRLVRKVAKKGKK